MLIQVRSQGFSGGRVGQVMQIPADAGTPPSRVNHLSTFTLFPAESPLSHDLDSFTPTANSLLVLNLGLHWRNTGSSDDTFTVSGGGLTWTKRAESATKFVDTAVDDYWKHQIWTAPIGGSPSSLVINIAGPNTTSTSHSMYQAVCYTGYNVASPIGATANGNELGQASADITLSASPASSSIVFASRHIGHQEAIGPTATPGSGWSEFFDQVESGVASALQCQERSGSTSATVSWADLADSAVTLDASQACAIEIKAA